jgi:hypothetical protein
VLSELGSQSNPSASFPSIGIGGVMFSDNFSEIGPASDGLIAQWKLDNNVRDYGGSDLSATIVGAPSFSIGLNNNYAVTLVDGDYYTFGSEADTLFDFAATQDFSLSAWFKSSTAATQRIFSKGGTAEDGWNLTLLSGGDVSLKLSDGTFGPSVSSTALLLGDGNWHHVVGVRDAQSTIILYVDGVYENQEMDTTTGNLTGSAFWIGRNSYADNDNFIGSLQDLRIYNKVLTAQEVNILYKMVTDSANTGMQLEADAWYVSKEFKGTL